MRYMVLMTALTLLIVTPAFSQDNQPAAAKAPEAQAPAPVKEEAPAAKELSIYGEVQAVNAPSNSMTVQYYDYDSDEEKNVEITVSADTKMENAKAIGDIKKGDWVDVSYTVSDGKNTAKSISVEKEEETPPEKPAAAAPADNAGEE